MVGWVWVLGQGSFGIFAPRVPEVLLSTSDVTRACGSDQFMTGMGIVGESEGEDSDHDPNLLAMVPKTEDASPASAKPSSDDTTSKPSNLKVSVDQLFKKPTKKSGVGLLRTSVGNALKDYRLVSWCSDKEIDASVNGEAADSPASPTSKFEVALAKLQVPCPSQRVRTTFVSVSVKIVGRCTAVVGFNLVAHYMLRN